MSNEYILEMKKITKTFPGVKALDEVDFNLKPGTVHTLMGENGAGKSTLMKCLVGIYEKDSGQILLDGEEVEFNNTLDAMNSGISMIHQELSPVLDRTVADNVWLGKYPLKNGIIIDHKKMRKECIELFERLDLDLDPDVKMRTLTVAKMQMVEIAKALMNDSKIIVMDEPTSALTENEVEHLFKMIANLKKDNIAVIYISHKMDEIFQISDELTVFRDGTFVSTGPVSEYTTDSLITDMVGRKVETMFPKVDCEIGEPIFKVENLSSGKQVKDVSFELRRGEILGFAGLVGAGRTETMESIFGVRRKDSGKIYKNGEEITINSPEQALEHGLAFLTEDRRGQGIVGILSVAENIVLANLKDYGFPIKHKNIKKDADEYKDKLRIKTPTLKEKIVNLSGGNQQKALVARCLLSEPDIIIVDEPTKGIDVGAKAEIHSILTQLAGEGKAIIMISSELPEVMGMADRIVVMYEGDVTGIIERDSFNQELIMKYATNT